MYWFLCQIGHISSMHIRDQSLTVLGGGRRNPEGPRKSGNGGAENPEGHPKSAKTPILHTTDLPAHSFY